MVTRILKRRFRGGPLDGKQRLLNVEVCEYEEVRSGGIRVEGKLKYMRVNHLYKLGSDNEFQYQGVK